MRELCLWLSAVDEEALTRCPGEASKFVAAGGAVLTTSLMAWLAGSFAAHSLLHLGIVFAILFGAGWALAIMNLERYIQSSIRRQATTVQTLLSALPRMALAVLLGLVITPFLMLVVFAHEDRTQVTVDRNEKLAHAREALEGQYASVPRLEREAAALQAALNTPPPVGAALSKSPAYHALAKRYGRYQAEARSLTDPRAAHAAGRAANDTLAQLGPLRSELLAQEANGNAVRHSEQQAKLSEAQRQLVPLQQALRRKNAELEKRYHEPSGLADQLEAMSVLTHRNSTVGWESTILLLFIMAIDVVPAFLKTLMCVGRRSVYEDVVDEMERTTLSEVRSEEQRWVREAERHAEEELEIQEEVGKARVAAQIAAQKEWDALAIGKLREMLKPYMAEWAEATAHHYAEQLREDIEEQRMATARRRAQRSPYRSGSLRAARGRGSRRDRGG
jgi:hypothetical protein